MNNNYNLYLLVNTNNNKTYIGITTDLNRRIKEHNSEKSRTKYTRANKSNGLWKLKAYITNLTKSDALSYEIRIKKKKINNNMNNIEKRIYIIKLITNIEPIIIE